MNAWRYPAGVTLMTVVPTAAMHGYKLNSTSSMNGLPRQRLPGLGTGAAKLANPDRQQSVAMTDNASRRQPCGLISPDQHIPCTQCGMSSGNCTILHLTGACAPLQCGQPIACYQARRLNNTATIRMCAEAREASATL
jgi:hypothetical protein